MIGTRRWGTRWVGAVCLCVAALMPGVAYGQGAFPTPTQITTDQAGTRPNNVYSPRFLHQTINGTNSLVLYFGGWYRTNPAVSPNDSIYRAVCSAPNVCGPVQLVINPVAFNLGSASLANNPTIVELHNGGQDYFVMYMTVVTGSDPNAGYTIGNNKIYYSTSYANDGVNWSKPQLLIDSAWLPSATVDAGGNVILYANTNGNNPHQPYLARYNLGTTGVSVGQPQAVVNNLNIAYANVEVKYHPSINLYQMVAQRNTGVLNAEIDYSDSVDGVNFTVRVNNIVPPGMTPGMHPDTACWVGYGVAGPSGSFTSNIFFKSWC